ncbi:hypothetical protein Sjap_020581 [Stephania japonica]|uniref:Pentatricopeptide repeat-containing protein n=1 Tax=Stephania japonica TaxID=461633 RepID=A0AAP0F3Q7_9MAGN
MFAQLEFKIFTVLPSCTFKQLKQIHAFTITTSLAKSFLISSKFLRRSTEFGGMGYSEVVFCQMDHVFPSQILLWNSMIRGYAYNGPYEKCIQVFDEMSLRGLKPNNYTYPYVLDSYCIIGNYKDGQRLHGQILKLGFEGSLTVANSLVDFYLRKESHCCCGNVWEGSLENENLSDGKKVFDNMVTKPVELWNRMITVFVNKGRISDARVMFQDMPERDIVSWNVMVSCYARIGDLKTARDFFDRMPEKNIVSWTAMVGAYASSGDLGMARRYFEKMPEINVVSWNSMITCYVRHGKYKEALDIFLQMYSENVNFDGFTFVLVLSACSQLGDLEFGKWIHIFLMKDWFQLGATVGTALIKMYAKCGDVDRALKVFIKMSQKDVFCWNVMIESLAIHGRSEDAIAIFNMMGKRGVKPNEFTFSNALFACNHGGLVEEGRRIFHSMKKDFGVNSTLKHYGSLIDLLGRYGQVGEAYLLMRDMPFKPDIVILGALLGGCRINNDLKLANKVMQHVEELKSNEPGVYVILSNMYASIGQWHDAAITREKMEQKRISKNAGCSIVLEVNHDED